MLLSEIEGPSIENNFFQVSVSFDNA